MFKTKKMKRIELKNTGIETPLQYSEIEIPVPKAGEVLIKNNTFSINPVDVKTRKGGGIYGPLKNEQPIILGWDLAGEVVSIGEKVDKFKSGDKVFGMINFPGHGQAYAKYVTAPQEHLAIIPENISYEDAAATTLAALTAYQILSRHVKKGDKIFVQAAAGGVGHFAVQIAKIMNAYVIGTASEKNEKYLKEIGIDEVINYKTTNFEEVVSEVDFALDAMGGEILERTISIVKNGGKIISIPTGVSEKIKSKASEKNIHVNFELVKSNGNDMRQLADWLSAGKIKPYIFKNYAFEEIELAHKQILTASTRGKVVVSCQ